MPPSVAVRYPASARLCTVDIHGIVPRRLLLRGNHRDQSCPSDDVSILSQSPGSGATDVPIGSNIIVALSTAPDVTVSDEHCTLTCGQTTIEGDCTFDAVTSLLVRDPGSPALLPEDSTCTVSLSTVLVCVSGQAAAWSFTTASSAGDVATAGTGTDSTIGTGITAPQNLTATAASDTIQLSWDSVSGAVRYNLYYGATGVSSETGTKIAGVVKPFGFTPGSAGTQYCFVATAQNAADAESDPSSEACATMPTTSNTTPDTTPGTTPDTTPDGDEPTGTGSLEILCDALPNRAEFFSCNQTACFFTLSGTSETAATVCSCPLQGGTHHCFVENLNQARNLSVDDANVYFVHKPSAGSSNLRISACPLTEISGTCTPWTVSDETATNRELVRTTESDGQFLYYSDPNQSRVFRVSIAANRLPGTVETVCQGLTTPTTGSAFVDGTNIYFTTQLNQKTITLCPKSGGAARDLVTVTKDLGDFLISDGTFLYFEEGTRSGSGAGSGDWTIQRVPVAGGTATTIATAHNLQSLGFDLAGSTLIYAGRPVANGLGGLLEIQTDGSSPQTLMDGIELSRPNVLGDFIYIAVGQTDPAYAGTAPFIARFPR